MRVLGITGRAEWSRAQVQQIRDQLDLGDDIDLELLGIEPLDPNLPVSRIDAVDPSIVPFRPVVPVSGDGLGAWRGGPKLTARALRAGRRVVRRMPKPRRWSRRSFLAVAAATSPELKARASEVDIIVALDAPAALAAWLLARRTDEPAVVFGPENVRVVLERMGRPVPAARAGRDSAPRQAVDGPPIPQIAEHVGNARVLIGPGNYAGQGWAWAEALRTHEADIDALSLRVGEQKTSFPTDYFVPGEAFNGDLGWRVAWRDFVESHATHIVIEANLPVLGGGTLATGEQNALELHRAGKTVALLSHGSDARVPSEHAARERWHSFDALSPAFLDRLERQARTNRDYYNRFPGTVFVSTPGILAFVPNGVWLPVVVDVDRWHTDGEPMQRAIPVVAHVPSSAQKGSHMIDPILSSMAERGLIEYLRVEKVPHSAMPELFQSADMMVEQFGIADYSVAACEAMAAGRVVISRVADDVRDAVNRTAGLELPIVEANPETLERVILDLIADPDGARAIAERGRTFVRAVHDGRSSAAVLKTWVTSTSS